MRGILIAGGLVFAVLTIGFAAAIIGIVSVGIIEAQEELN